MKEAFMQCRSENIMLATGFRRIVGEVKQIRLTPQIGQRTDFTMRFSFGLIPSHTIPEVNELAVLGQRLGYSIVWVADQALYRDVYVVATAIASATRKIGVGVGVTNPYTRHPAVTARAIATLDDVSNGRAVLGIAIGNATELLQPLGLLTGSPADDCEEALRIIRSLISGEEVNFSGHRYQLKGVKMNFKARKSIPINVATTTSERILRIAGAYADGAIIAGLVYPPAIDHAIRTVLDGAQLNSRNLRKLEIISWVPLQVTQGEGIPSRLRSSTARFIGQTSTRALARFGFDLELLQRINSLYRIEGIERSKRYVTDELVRQFAIIGTPSECISKIEELSKAGVSHIVIPYLGDSIDEKAQNLRTIGSKVIRHFSEEEPER